MLSSYGGAWDTDGEDGSPWSALGSVAASGQADHFGRRRRLGTCSRQGPGERPGKEAAALEGQMAGVREQFRPPFLSGRRLVEVDQAMARQEALVAGIAV